MTSPTTSPIESSPASIYDAIRSGILAFQHLMHSEAALLDEIASEYEQKAAYWRKRHEQSAADLTWINRLAAAAQEGEH